jgi:hypothetical protein
MCRNDMHLSDSIGLQEPTNILVDKLGVPFSVGGFGSSVLGTQSTTALAQGATMIGEQPHT